MKRIYRYIALLLTILLFLSHSPSFAKAEELPFEIQSKSAVLLDYSTGTLLFEKNSQEKLPIASVTKIMTILLALEAIDEGSLNLKDKIRVSEYASSMGGSQVFLYPGEELTVDSILKAIVVSSANDASVALAEKLAGSHEVFVSQMNNKARDLGMENTNFTNATGLPDENNYSSAYDVALMSRELLSYPLFFNWSTIWVDTLEESQNKTGLANTNRLIRFYDGSDGIKTGFTNDAGHCLSATAKRGNLRLISIILSAPTSKERFNEAVKLMDYGFANFESLHFVKKDEILHENIQITGGKEEFINGIAGADINLLLKSDQSKEFDKEILIDEVIKAPVSKGQKIGTINILQNGKIVEISDVLADRDVKEANFIDYFKKLFNNWARKEK